VSAFAAAVATFACAFLGALLGIGLASALPDHHRSGDSRDVIKLAIGMIATLSALVLGLLVATGKGAFDQQAGTVNQMATKVILLDRMLGWYGPESGEARTALRASLALTLAHLWPEGAATANLSPGEVRGRLEQVYERIAALRPTDDAQRSLKSEALRTTTEVAELRLQLFVVNDTTIPPALLVVLISWMTVLFFAYGLLSPRNHTLMVALCVCALSVAGAIFLVLELGRPFEGLIRLSRVPLQDALAHLGE
jgi:hypothetical protein